MTSHELVYVSGRRAVRAVDPRDGSVVWKHALDERFSGYVTLILHDPFLLVAHKDSLYGLDARTGDRLWKRREVTNKHGPAMMISGRQHDPGAVYAMMAEQQEIQAAAAATSG